MSNKIKITILCILTVFGWALAFPFSKIAMHHYGPYSLGFLRVTVASAALLIMGLFKGIRPPKLRHLGLFLISGACGFGIYLFAFNRGIQTLSSASSSILVATTPVMTAVGAHFLYKEKINPIGWVTLVTAFLGVALMMLWDGILSINEGIIWTLLAAVVFCCYNLLNRKLSKMGYTAEEIVTYSMMAAIIVLSPFSARGLSEIQSAVPKDIIVLLILSFFSSAGAYYLWSKALSLTKNTSDVTNFGFLTPFVATLLGSVVLSEVPSISTDIGGTIIILSIVIFSLKGKVSS